ncbi:MAG: extracellular solute-binding protein [Angelakisella sp.]
MKISRWIWPKMAIAFSLSMALMTAVGCQNSSTPKLDPNAPVSVKIWHYYNGPQETAFNTLVNDFNETVGSEKGIFVEAASQGNVGQLTQTVLESANNMVGSQPLPDIFAAYADNAFEMDKMGVVASLDAYMTKDELALYNPGYLEEGRFDHEKSFKIFPVAKSTELMLLNKTDWDKFSAATGADLSALSTMEGVAATAKAYYNWTDGFTPTPRDGKAFFGRDSMSNYMFIGAKQLGAELFTITDGKATLNLDSAILRRLWDNFYIPYINGHFTAFGRFRSDDIKTGDIIAMVGSTSGVPYFPSQVISADNSSYDIEMLTLPAPRFEGSEAYAVQQGAGMVVVKSDPKTELAAVTFLKWFTEKEQNVKFSLLSGYLPVTVAGATTESLNSFLAVQQDHSISDKLVSSLPVAFEVCRTHNMYTNKPFSGGTEARAVLEKSLIDWARADYEQLLNTTDDTAYAELLAMYSTDKRFDEWQAALKSQIGSTIPNPNNN